MLLKITNGTLSAGGRVLLSHFCFSLHGGDHVALIGSNGCGKSTFLRMLAGEIPLDADDGLCGKDPMENDFKKVVCLPQDVLSGADCSVEEALGVGQLPAGLEADVLFTKLGFRVSDKKRPVSDLSGGERVRLGLIACLTSGADLLLLDEPTNHLDTDMLAWLEEYIRGMKTAVVFVSHDRYFISRAADGIWEMDGGRLSFFHGGYEAYKKEKTELLKRTERKNKALREERDRLEAVINRFKGKANKAAFARAKKKQLERMKQPEQLPQEKRVLLPAFLPADPGPKKVLEAKDLAFGYDKGRAAGSICAVIRRGERVGVFGKNGAGKTALIKTLLGILPPLSGQLLVGVNIQMGYLSQQSGECADQAQVLLHLMEHAGVQDKKEAEKYLAGCGIYGRAAYGAVADLSGGERVRLLLLEELLKRPNVLILDEPTNHLDIGAAEALEKMLESYAGTLIFVSHDRFLLAKLAQRLIVFSEDSVSVYPCGYEIYAKRFCGALAPACPDVAKEEADILLAGHKKALEAAERVEAAPLHPVFDSWEFRVAKEEFSRREEEFLKAKEACLYIDPQDEVAVDTCERCREEAFARLHRACLLLGDIYAAGGWMKET